MASYQKGIQLFKNIYSKINEWVGKNEKPTNFLHIVEPLSCMIRLGMLKYKTDGTKVSINDNRIYYNEPNVFQGAVRWTYGDTRNDLHYLLQPILKATKWYNPSKNEYYKIIFENTILGLEKLKRSYQIHVESNLVCHTIDLYISLINDSLRKSSTIEGEDFEPPSYEIEEETPICKKFKVLWLENQIELITKLFIQLNSDEKNVEHYLKAIESILFVIENQVSEIVYNIHNYDSSK